MKKLIKKLMYSSLAAFISISVNFDTEARLPKYMAQRAAELLMEKSELLRGVITEAEECPQWIEQGKMFILDSKRFPYAQEVII